MQFLITVDMLVAKTNSTTLTTMDITIVTVATIPMTGTETLGPITQMKSLLTMIHRLKTLQSPQVIAMRTSSI